MDERIHRQLTVEQQRLMSENGTPAEFAQRKFCVCGNIEGTAVDDCERCLLLSIINEQRSQIQKLQSLPIFDVLPRFSQRILTKWQKSTSPNRLNI